MSQTQRCRIFPFEPVAFLLVLLAGLLSAGCSKGPQEAPQPPVVEVMPVIQKDVPIYHEWVGTLDGTVNATIRAQVQGYLVRQNYRDGEFVKKGKVLFEIDPRNFQATLDQAMGQLEANQARWMTAKANLARIKPLADLNAVSKKDLDDATGAEQSARASVLSAQAAVDKAKLQLEFTRVVSPVDGIAGLAKAQIGDLVGPGAMEELTTVSTVNPIKAFIQVSEREYLQASRHAGPRNARLNAELILADGSVYPHRGAFAFADRQVDVKTGTMRVATTFPNPGNVLRPGQYGKIRVAIATQKSALLVPQRAVTEMQGNHLVTVVGPGNKADVRPVKAGSRVDSLWLIEAGLQPGETVVVEGIMKVRPGMTVVPKPYAPAPTAGPAGAGDAPAAKPAGKADSEPPPPAAAPPAIRAEKR